jgi:hypothetical protein
MERGLTQPTQQTFVGQGAGKTVGVGPTGTRSAADEATVMENFGAAAPTAVEQKWAPQPAAEPTVIERKIGPQKKSNTAMIAGIAAVVVIAIVAGVVVMMKKQPAATVVTNTASGTQITTTAPIAPGKGQLLLSAAPNGDIEKIVGADQKLVPLSDEETTLPRRLELPPGSYQVTIAGPNGPKTVTVNIEAGKKTSEHVTLGNVDIDTLTKEIQK